MRIVNTKEIEPACFSVYKFERVDIDDGEKREEKFENPQLLFRGESCSADCLFGWVIARAENKKCVGGETILFAVNEHDEARFPEGWYDKDLKNEET